MDEDYSDYENEEFHEDQLTNDEYEQLHEVLPLLKLELAPYNDEIPEYDLKEALYYNYFEIEPTVDELKSKFKKSKYPLAYWFLNRFFPQVSQPLFPLLRCDFALEIFWV